MATNQAFDLVGAIMDYETGNLGDRGIVELFSHLVETGQAWTLQGHYGRTAAALLEAGVLNEDGSLTEFALDTLEEFDA